MIIEIIDSICHMSSKSNEEIEALVEKEQFGKGDIILKKGQRNSKEYFVLDGICRSFLINPEGEEITIAFFAQGSILSPYVTRTREGYSNLNFQASVNTTLGSMDAGKFEELMVNNLEIRNFGNTVLKNELNQKVDKEIGMASLTAKERLIKFRQQFPLFENLIPHTEIASYLGITNISLSRLRSEIMK